MRLTDLGETYTTSNVPECTYLSGSCAHCAHLHSYKKKKKKKEHGRAMLLRISRANTGEFYVLPRVFERREDVSRDVIEET